MVSFERGNQDGKSYCQLARNDDGNVKIIKTQSQTDKKITVLQQKATQITVTTLPGHDYEAWTNYAIRLFVWVGST